MFLSWNKKRVQVQPEEVGNKGRKEQSLLLMVKQKDEEAQSELKTELKKNQQQFNEVGTELKHEIKRIQEDLKEFKNMKQDLQTVKLELIGQKEAQTAQKAEQEKLLKLVQHLVHQLAPLISEELTPNTQVKKQ